MEEPEPVTPDGHATAGEGAPPGGVEAGSRRGRAVRGVATHRATGWIVAAALVGAVVALAVTGVTSSSSTQVAFRSVAAGPGFRVAGPPARVKAGPPFSYVGSGRFSHGSGAPPGAWVVTPGARMNYIGRPGPLAVFAAGQFAYGTVKSVSSSSFTITTAANQSVTVDKQGPTIYRSQSGTASASAVTAGAKVVVFGPRDGSTIHATEVLLLP